MNNTNQVHPIEFFLACLINLIEFICYIINEIAGFHAEEINDSTIDTASVHSLTTTNTDYIDHIYTLTVKQLQEITGIRSSRYRKADLQLLAITA